MSAMQGRRILVTRARGQASALADLLRQQGAEPILIPTIELAPPASWCALDAALTTLRSYDWLLFTSANAVEAFMQRARTLKLSPNPRRIAVIGPATAKAVLATGLATQVDLMPGQYVPQAFAEALTPHAAGAAMLLIRAAAATDVLPGALIAAGADLTIASAYRNIIPQGSIEDLRTLFVSAPPDAITFTSASTAQNLAALLETAQLSIPAATVLASIGPLTSQAMRELTLTPAMEADASTIPSLVEAMANYFDPRQRRSASPQTDRCSSV